MIRGVIFDLDGTLADTLPVCFAAFRAALKEFTGREYSNGEIEALFGPSEEGAIRRVVPDRCEDCAKVFWKEYEAAHNLCPDPFPGILELLDMLKSRDIPAAIVTGKGPRSAAISLRILRLDTRFEIMEAGSPEGSIKTQAIRKVLDLWNLPAHDVVYVGDAVSDILNAREAGVIPVAAAWAESAHVDTLAAQSPKVLFRTVKELADWIAANGANQNSSTT